MDIDKEQVDPSIRTIIVAAACKFKINGKLVVLCDFMHCGQNIQTTLSAFNDIGVTWEQIEDGFIDNIGDFKTREEAMAIVKLSGQPFSFTENMGDTTLFSEGIRRLPIDKSWSDLTGNY